MSEVALNSDTTKQPAALLETAPVAAEKIITSN